MPNFSESFQQAFEAELKRTQSTAFGPKLNAFKVGGVFTDILKKVIDSIGLGNLTKEQFLALVSAAYDTFTATMQIPFFLKPILKGLVLTVAGAIYDKRIKPTPSV